MKSPSDELGAALIAELANRGSHGNYFDYAGYQKLRVAETVEEVQALLDGQGFASVRVVNDPVWIADGLEEAAADRQPPAIVEFSVGILAYPLWLLTRLHKKRRVFPRRKRNRRRYRPPSRR